MNEATETASEAVIRLQKVCKDFGEGTQKRSVLIDVDLQINRGDRIAIVGPSGSGKSTLLNILAGLDQVSSGLVERSGLSGEGDDALAKWRNQCIGFVFQDHHLLPQCTLLENILMPVNAYAQISEDTRARAKSLLQDVGMGDRADSFPQELSGGERQRIAVLRSMIMQPSIILADEPTGALDQEHADQVVSLLERLQSESGTALVIVTHHLPLAERMDKQLHLSQSKLQ